MGPSEPRGDAVRVYLDVIFALNGVINYLLLCASGRLCGTMPRRGRLIPAALLGALYACGAVLPGMGFFSRGVWRIAVLALMVLLAFGKGRSAILSGGVFLALSLALGGLMLMLSTLLGAQIWLLEGKAYYLIGFPTLVLTAGALYLGAWLLQGGMAHTGGGLVRAKLTVLGECTELTALRDSGNTLRDPFSGRPIPVVEGQVLTRLLPRAERALTRDAVQAMALLHEELPRLRLRLIPYRAVGTQQSLLLAVRADDFCVGGRRNPGLYVAISPTKVSENGQYEGLIGEGE